MKIFLDTANINEIKDAASLGILDGVTTNPSLVAKEKKDFKKLIGEICEIVDGPVSAEVIAMDCENMVKEALELTEIAKNVVVKIPFVAEGLKATKILSGKGIHVNMTLIFSLNQALLACKAGAKFISPFVGRLDDIGHDGFDLAVKAQEMIFAYSFETEVIAASIRNPLHVVRAIESGVDIVTIPHSIISQMFKHPLTDIGIERFLKDWEAAQK